MVGARGTDGAGRQSQDTADQPGPADPAPTSTGRSPVVLVVTVVLGLVIVAAAAFGGPLRFGPPPWQPGTSTHSALPAAPDSGGPSPAAPTAATGHRSHFRLDLTWPLLVLSAIALLLVAVFVARRLIRRQRRGPVPILPAALLTDGVTAIDDPSSASAMPSIRRGLDRALDELGQDRAPSDAITAAWLGLQEAAEDAGYRRQPAETPTEFTARVLFRLELDGRAVRTLRDLYVLVRFGTTPVGPAEVDAARAALQTLRDHWRDGAGAR